MHSLVVDPVFSVSQPGPASARRCRVLLAVLVLVPLLVHVLYLAVACPIDLCEDEAYYWDWSRQLDISYYSKGPLTAWLIHASCAVLGHTPLAVRLPALLLGAGTTLALYALAQRLWGHAPLALGVAALSYLLPLFLAGRLIMTTDPPALFFWALAMLLAAEAVFSTARLPWVGLGLVVGLGFLAKFSVPLFFVGLALFLLTHSPARALLRTAWPYASLLIVLLFSVPVWLWNARHDWVTLRHVGEDVAAQKGASAAANMLDFVLGQLGVAGPLLFPVILLAVAWAWRHRTAHQPTWPRWAAADGSANPAADEVAGLHFLLAMGLPLFVLIALLSPRSHPSASWTAAAYLPLTLLTACFLWTRWTHPRYGRWWRWVIVPALGVNALLIGLAHDSERLYPLFAGLNHRWPGLSLTARQVDPTYRVHGWREVGQQVSEQLRGLPRDALILSQTYEWAAICAFYVEGQPKTYVAGTYFADLSRREPFNQYDFWPDRALDQPALVGRDAIYLGAMTEDLRAAFDGVESLAPIRVSRSGLPVRQIDLWRCRGFHGLSRPNWLGRYNK